MSLSTRTLRRELMRIRVNRPPIGKPPSKGTGTVARWSNGPKKQDLIRNVKPELAVVADSAKRIRIRSIYIEIVGAFKWFQMMFKQP